MKQEPSFVGNHFFSALGSATQKRLSDHLTRVEMPLGQILYESGDVLRYVYLPIDAIVSLLQVTEAGKSAELSVVGNEGVIGVALFMGGDSMTNRAVVQSAGGAYRVPASQFKAEIAKYGDLHLWLLRYTQTLITQLAQSAACNRHHSILQQLCRWLLLSHDRLPDNHILMTQELIANMLGVRREGVTHAAGKLRQLNVIRYHRGSITILDRRRLEALSCECYAVVKRETDRLLPYASGRRAQAKIAS